MDRLGTFCLALGLVLALYGLIAAIWGVRRGRPPFVESARTATYGVLAAVAAANGAMVAALLANDFHLRYVAENSSRETPAFFKVLALWSADDGSLLLWNLILAAFAAAVAYRFRKRRPETLPWAMATLFGVQAFYLALVSGPSQPFATIGVRQGILTKWKGKGPPYPVAQDLVDELKAKTPPEQLSLITDLFETITLYDLHLFRGMPSLVMELLRGGQGVLSVVLDIEPLQQTITQAVQLAFETDDTDGTPRVAAR